MNGTCRDNAPASHSAPKNITTSTGPSMKLGCALTHNSCRTTGKTKNDFPFRSREVRRNKTSRTRKRYSKRCARIRNRECAFKSAIRTTGLASAQETPIRANVRSTTVEIATTRSNRTKMRPHADAAACTA
jgi:hypothetical protein